MEFIPMKKKKAMDEMKKLEGRNVKDTNNGKALSSWKELKLDSYFYQFLQSKLLGTVKEVV